MAKEPVYSFRYEQTNFQFQDSQKETDAIFNTFAQIVLDVLKNECGVAGLTLSRWETMKGDRRRGTIGNAEYVANGGSGSMFHAVLYFTTDNMLKISDLAFSVSLIKGLAVENVLESIRKKLIENKVISANSQVETEMPQGVKSGGCYVATAVYGSYDCPEVWTLRRFRDYGLAKSFAGRAFIKVYYAISPTLVKHFGDSEIFKRFWKVPLDRLVNYLKEKGVDDSEYEDIIW